MDYKNLTIEQSMSLFLFEHPDVYINQFIKLFIEGYGNWPDISELKDLLSYSNHKLYVVCVKNKRFRILDYTTNKLYRINDSKIETFDIPIKENILQKFDIKRTQESYYKIGNQLLYIDDIDHKKITEDLIPTKLKFLLKQDNIIFIDTYLLDHYLRKQFLSLECID